uniref:HECT domain-containing protein n=1 Tax=Amphimedon queenslandica TaxID=400682 RepID=A0A1X7V671_AMPQE
MEQSSKEITAACNEQAPLMMKIAEIKKQIDTDETMFLDVCRGFVLIDAMRQAAKKKLNPNQLLKIRFVGESAIDHGGLKRKFFHLLAPDVSNNYFSGADNGSRFLINIITGVQNRKYYYLGVYFVLSVLYGGNGFPLMHDSLFNYLVYQSIDTSTVSVDNIPDQALKFLVNKVTC